MWPPGWPHSALALLLKEAHHDLALIPRAEREKGRRVAARQPLYSTLVGTNLLLSIFLPYSPVNTEPALGDATRLFAACVVPRRWSLLSLKGGLFMVNRRIDMRQIRDVLTYLFERRLSKVQTSKVVGIHRATVHKYLARFQQSGLPWPLPPELDDAAFERLLFPINADAANQGVDDIDFAHIHAEMQKRGATLSVLYAEWLEKSTSPKPISYSQFCRQYKQYKKSLRISMRRTEIYGQNAYVDYSGMTIPIVDQKTGEARPAQVFIGVLGGSGYTYCEATWTQRSRDWLSSHARMLDYFGGVPCVIIPDNLKAAVTKADRLVPEINESYRAMCRHYNAIPFPARAYHPKDKAKAEGAVLLAQRWILFVLRRHTFFSLEEANRAIRVLLDKLNHKTFQKQTGSRYSRWLENELPTLQPLPATPYEFAEWGKVRAGSDYHVCIDGHSYSVPYQLRGKELDYRMTDKVVELIANGKVVASHPRSFETDQTTTLATHQAPAHRSMQWDKESALAWAESIGPNTAAVLNAKIEKVKGEIMGYRVTQTMKSLLKAHGAVRLEEACAYAFAHKLTLGSDLRTVLDKRLDRLLAQEPAAAAPANIDHPNIRGAHYYDRLLATDEESQS